MSSEESYTPRLRGKYSSEIVPLMMKRLNIKNINAVPRLEKIVINMGLGEGKENIKVIDNAIEELAQIAGQRPVIRRAKKSIAAFKLRTGHPIGVSVTLRRAKMYEFLDRLINVALPRVRDFRGLPRNAFDRMGNYTFGLKDQLVFPEIDYSKVDKIKGMNITIVTTTNDDEQARFMLECFGFPFVRK